MTNYAYHFDFCQASENSFSKLGFELMTARLATEYATGALLISINEYIFKNWLQIKSMIIDIIEPSQVKTNIMVST